MDQLHNLAPLIVDSTVKGAVILPELSDWWFESEICAQFQIPLE